MRTIREQAFADTECKTVILSPGIHEVEKWAFRNSRLEQLYIYDDLEKISDYAFQDCDMLRTLHINSIEAPAYSGNYFDTFQDKYDRLLSLKDKKKIVLFSGSSTRFGYDSAMLDQAFPDYEVVNMGVFAYSPALPQLELIRSCMKEGDILLDSPEFDAANRQFCYQKELDYATFAMMESNYDAFADLDLREYAQVFTAFSAYQTARQDIERKNYDVCASDYDEDGNEVEEPSYNEYGDYVVYRPNSTSEKPIYGLPVNYTVNAFPKETYIDSANAEFQKFIGEFAASLCWQIYYYMTNARGMHGEFWRWAELIVVYAVIFTILALIELSLKKDLEEIHITRRELLVVIIIATSVFAMSNLSYLDQDGLFSGSFVMDIFIIRTLVDLSGIAVLYAYHVQVKEIQIRFEKDTLRNIMEMQYKNYQLSKENIDMVNQKYHDLKHQINLLKTQSYAQAGKSTSYLEKMEREIRVYETQNKTGNPILDAVLTNKALLCQNKEIELKFIVDGGALSFMEDMDVSALFGNMLDNAIESAQKQQEKQKRLIWLYVTREKQFVRIRTENYCDEKIQFKNGMPVTTKKDRRLHGYGMKSIKSTVEKYNGSVVAAQENNWFELKILLPAAM